MAVLSSILMIWLSMISAATTRKKYKWNSTGEKKIKKLRKSLKTSKLMEITQMMLQKNKQKRKQEPPYKIASNSLKNLKSWEKKTPGTVPNARISFWLKSRCKFTRRLRFSYCALKDSKENSTTLKNSICKVIILI